MGSESPEPAKTHNTNKGQKVAWDKGVKFPKAREELIGLIRKSHEQCLLPDDPESPYDWQRFTRLTHYSTISIQLVNGSRAQEAVDAMIGWANTGKREVNVRVRKLRPPCYTCHHVKTSTNPAKGHEILGPSVRGKCKNAGCTCKKYVAPPEGLQETRRMVIPPECTEDDRPFIQRTLARKAYSSMRTRYGAYMTFASRHFSNTHSLRYSWITMMGKNNVAPQLIAKVTHHKSLDQLLAYTQQKAADDILDDVVGRSRDIS